MKKLATLFLLAAACGPGLVEFPVVPPAPGPGGGENPPPPQTPADCSATLGTVLCGTQCVPLGPTNCGLNTANGFCEDCTAKGPGFTCSAGVCVPPTACAAGLVVCASGCCTATQVAAGGNTSCALVGQANSTGVYCWGANDSGQLGPAGGAATSSGIATEIADLHGATAVAIGSGHGCAIMANQTVMCWGKNDRGQLGSGASASQSAAPVLVPDVTSAVAIAVGDQHSCAISTVSGVVCWGANDRQQLGDKTVLPTLTGATKIVAGANHTCAMSSASVVCWGANESGQIGNGASQVDGGVAPFTVPLTGNTGTVDIAAGSSHTCAIISGTGITGTNGVRCWGSNGSGQIDTNGQSGPNRTSPVIMVPFNSPKLPDGIAAGRAHTCTRRGTDEECIGDNAFGQLTTATNLKGTSIFGLLVAGGDHTCLIDTTNEIRCFGRNASSELGPFGP